MRAERSIFISTAIMLACLPAYPPRPEPTGPELARPVLDLS